MSVIRVNPESIRTYASQATDCLSTARVDLEALVRSVVEVRYEGPNASKFKTECGEIASRFSSQMTDAFAQIGMAVQTSTSNISGSLGGEQVIIRVDGSPVVPPAVPAAGAVVDVDVSGLEALLPVVTQKIESVRTQLDQNLSMLQSTDWQGAAKESAVSSVQQITTSAKAKSTEAETSIKQFIQNQIDAVRNADK